MVELPLELVLKVVEYLDLESLKNLRQVCRRTFTAVTARSFKQLTIYWCDLDEDWSLRRLSCFGALSVSEHTRSLRIRTCSSPQECSHTRAARRYRNVDINEIALRRLLGNLVHLAYSNGDEPSSLGGIPLHLGVIFRGVMDTLRSLTITGSKFSKIFLERTFVDLAESDPFFRCLEEFRLRRVEDNDSVAAFNYANVAGFLYCHAQTLTFCEPLLEYCSLKDWDMLQDTMGESTSLIRHSHPGTRMRMDYYVSRINAASFWNKGKSIPLAEELASQYPFGIGWTWRRHGHERAGRLWQVLG